jgi:hypothetical protein
VWTNGAQGSLVILYGTAFDLLAVRRPQIGATRSAAPATNRRGPAIPRTRAAIPSNVNALEGTDATTYRLGSGASIQVSGTLIQGAETSCSKNCPVDPVRPKTTR